MSLDAIERRAARAAETAASVLIMIDACGQVIYANGAAEPLFGRSRQRLIGADLEELGAWGRVAGEIARRARISGREVLAHDVSLHEGDERLRGAIDAVPDGDDLCLVIRPTPAASVQPSGEGAANAAVGFGRLLSHELKNPIAGARGAAQLISQTADGETAELAAIIMTELDRARRIAEHWSRIGDVVAGEATSINLHALAREAIASARVAAGNEIRFQEAFDPSLPEAWGDRDLLLQAVLNLLTNSAEAIARHGDGLVRLTTRYRRLGPGSAAPDARLELEVLDTGPGVPDRLAGSIFNPFVTGKPAGEGLGLAFVSRVADLHNGAVEFESRPGRTVFKLFLQEARDT
ncbi:ATPase [Marinicauda pacifica]|uniref:histidine kinase n=1 Tax=Marinicauda pacifica TaxID=1133559 RepID=A0A4V3RZJ3_9PROT|nr:ATP-binding protein [Marinicauda pacifica]TGY94489.1 PAS domain-containing protein [Marinicauda pacifica]GGE36248.1 ATPase [Marinicauda pacifica]